MGSCSSLLIIMMLLMFPVPISAQQSSNRNVTLGASIMANADATPTWTSPSGEFALGFRQVEPAEGFLLAIWFDQIPEKTIVWSANRDDPAPSGSIVRLYENGTLGLTDQTGRRIWANQQARSGTVAYGAVLDTGNLVLATNNSAVLWQSFDWPTDTLLPSQVLNVNGVVVSSFSETNHSRGRFKMTLEPDGNLSLYTRRFPLDANNVRYWSSETLDSGIFRLVFNQSDGSIYLVALNGSVVRPLFDSGAPVGEFHQRLVLEYDGVLRHYVYSKSAADNSSSTWSARDFVPPNICRAIDERESGGGACGFNGICSMGANGRPSCHCPDRYTSRGGLTGCMPVFELHGCADQRQEAQHFEFRVLYNTDWPHVDYEEFRDVEEHWCEQSCLHDCFCAVAIHFNGNCYKKPLPFFNGREDSGYLGKAFVKVRRMNNTSATDTGTYNSSNNSCTRERERGTLVITLSVFLGCAMLLFLLSSFFTFVFYFRIKKLMMVHPTSTVNILAGVNTIRSFSLKELQEATDGFKDELGSGACSTVYKGTLSDGKVVAVKKLDKISKEADVEFIAEVSSISRTNHKNLVQLLGYCDEGQHRILVYELMSNGSLASFLFQNPSRPNWHTRVHIAFAIARGLCYLHEECSIPIIHCDIKPQNVLLDESYTPKIADFGLAKLMRADQTRTITIIRGTRGYVAPEWFRNMPITLKVDVYSFGILLLELVCCRKNYEVDVEDEREVVLADWVYDCYQDGALDLLVADDEDANNDMQMLERLVMTAIWCIQEDPTLRPHMKRVMHMLDGSIQVPAPPNPTTIFIS